LVVFNRAGVFSVRNVVVSSLEDLGHEDLPAFKSLRVGNLIGLWSLWSLVSAIIPKFTAICVVLVMASCSPDD
jgi:hypothetical protein